jgi:hypothetical protein
MPIMLWQGLPLVNGGRLAVAESCCCEDVPDECICTCTEYSVTLTGISDTDFNQEYTLPVVSQWVTWSDNDPDNVQATILCNFPIGYYSLVFHKPTIGGARYQLPMVDWDCQGTNTMELATINGFTTGWPATLDATCTDEP